MKAATLLKVLRDVVTVLEAEGVITSSDEFAVLTPVGYANLVNKIEIVLKAHGVNEPEKLDKITDALPGILMLLGLGL